MNALVLDGSQRAALAVTRSLGRRGIDVLVGDCEGSSLASASRYCVGHVRYPRPEVDPDGFQSFLLGFVRREPIDVIVPVTDVTTHLVAAKAVALKHCSAVAAPPFEAFAFVSDKGALLRHAATRGVPVPRTQCVDGPAQLDAALERLEYPVVIKSTRSHVRSAGRWRRTSVEYADSEAEVRAAYRAVDYLNTHPSLIQERIEGHGMGLFVLFDHGRLVTAFSHRRIREKPPSGGVSVLCESVAVDPHLKELAARLLEPLGWHGVAMLEFKRERRSGICFLMEINGRFWGSLQLAIDAGVDFPYLNYRLALGDSGLGSVPYREGVRSRWLLGDFDHLLIRLTRSRRALRLPASSPSPARVAADFFRFAQRGLRYDTMRRDDWRPFVHELTDYGRALAAGARHALRHWPLNLCRPARPQAPLKARVH